MISGSLFDSIITPDPEDCPLITLTTEGLTFLMTFEICIIGVGVGIGDGKTTGVAVEIGVG